MLYEAFRRKVMVETTKIVFEAIKLSQHGEDYYQIVITPTLLQQYDGILKMVVPTYDPDNGKGYQRLPSDKRLTEIAKYIGGGGDEGRHCIPNSVLLNHRGNRNRIKFTPIRNGSRIGTLEIIGSSITLYIVDGQHRFLGWKRRTEQVVTKGEDPNDMELFAFIMHGTEDQEKVQFSVINKTAEGVKPALIATLTPVIRKVETGNMMNMPTRVKTEINKEDTFKIATMLNEAKERHGGDLVASLEDNPWRDRLIRPNESKTALKRLTTKSLSDYLHQAGFSADQSPYPVGQDSLVKRALLVSNYWKAIKSRLPSAWAEPSRYLVQSHIGVQALMMLLPTVMGAIPNSIGTVPGVEEFNEILSRCGDMLSAEFWEKGGKASRYHGRANVSLLVREMKDKINPKDEAA